MEAGRPDWEAGVTLALASSSPAFLARSRSTEAKLEDGSLDESTLLESEGEEGGRFGDLFRPAKPENVLNN